MYVLSASLLADTLVLRVNACLRLVARHKTDTYNSEFTLRRCLILQKYCSGLYKCGVDSTNIYAFPNKGTLAL